MLGRTDDVINVAGHRLGTREIEEAVQAHPGIAEVAVVGVADPLKGQIPVAFAVVKDASRVATPEGAAQMSKEVMATVDRELGAIARPGAVHFVTLLPKTRSGKLLRRTIQALAEGRDPGDLTTIEDPAALEQIRAALEGRLTAAALAGLPFRATCCPVSRSGRATGDNSGLAIAARPCPTRLPADRPRALAPPRALPGARAGRGRHPRRRDRQRSLRDRSPSSTAMGACCIAAGDPGRPDDDEERAEAVPGDAVRRRRRHRALRLFHGRRPRCFARAIPASRATSPRSPTCWPRRATPSDDLQCGTHVPGFYEQRGEMPPPPPYSPLAHNCSGKHSGMLAYCVQCGLPKESYLDYDHPLQQAIRRAVAHFTSTPEADLVAGIDGCSAPNYAVPLERLALAFARLARPRR